MPSVESALVVFDAQGPGCLSYAVEEAGHRRLVKTAATVEGSLDRAVAVHAAVRCPAIVRSIRTIHGAAGPTLVYPGCDGGVLNRPPCTTSGLARFQHLPVPQVEVALGAILDAHLAVSAAGLVAIDLYDGCGERRVPTKGMAGHQRAAPGRGTSNEAGARRPLPRRASTGLRLAVATP
ncbi:hypothetical protein [Micromonospora foliorum]|uniref:hypothetical protein n=1 Tax=Micromonospora foliorum TaxID=2911210 RepID=UPI001EE9AD35|nr:hypothetical protein [Micromonospora foliorum]MCG5440031.1 hypothetical protein [Micromonospora foliorum]